MNKINYDYLLNLYIKNKRPIKMMLFVILIISIFLVFYGLGTYNFDKPSSCIFLSLFIYILFATIVCLTHGHYFEVVGVKEKLKKLYVLINFYELSLFFMVTVIGCIYAMDGRYPVYFYVFLYALPFMFIMRPALVSTLSVGGSIIILLFYVFNNDYNSSYYVQVILSTGIDIFVIYKAYLANYRQYETEKNLIELSYKDTLTGLYNRRSLIQYVDNKEILNTDLLLMVDCDNFKQVNDTFGHEYGDQFLIELGDLLKNNFNSKYCFRVGGDEFIVISHFSKEEIEAKMKRINKELLLKFRVSGISVGGAICEIDNIENSIRKADRALYSTKEKNKGTVSFFDEDSI